MSNPVVGIIMGSSSDKDVMKAAADVLKKFGVPYEFTVVSAHRSPHWMYEYCEKAQGRGVTESAVSHHMRGLRQMRLVKSRRDGKEVYYFVDDPHIIALFRQGVEHIKTR